MKKCLRSVLAKLWGVLLSFLLVTHGPSNSCTSEKPSWLRRDGGGVSIKGIWLWHCFLEHADLLPSSEGLGQVMGDELVTMTWAFRDRKKKLLFFFLKHIFCVQFIKSLIRLVGPRGGGGRKLILLLTSCPSSNLVSLSTESRVSCVTPLAWLASPQFGEWADLEEAWGHGLLPKWDWDLHTSPPASGKGGPEMCPFMCSLG